MFPYFLIIMTSLNISLFQSYGINPGVSAQMTGSTCMPLNSCTLTQHARCDRHHNCLQTHTDISSIPPVIISVYSAYLALWWSWCASMLSPVTCDLQTAPASNVSHLFFRRQAAEQQPEDFHPGGCLQQHTETKVLQSAVDLRWDRVCHQIQTWTRCWRQCRWIMMQCGCKCVTEDTDLCSVSLLTHVSVCVDMTLYEKV